MNLIRTYLAHKHCRTAHTWTRISTTNLLLTDGRTEPRAHRVCLKCGVMDELFPGTVVYYNGYYDGMIHQLAEFGVDGIWYDADYYGNSEPLRPAENATVVYRTYGKRGPQ